MRDYTTGIVLTGDARDKVRQRAAQHYAAGLSIRAISRALGRSYGGTRVLLLEAGVTLRGRGGAIRKAAV
ncbi:helix-turn-helix domain-containing protein [Streptomyces adelaidensis]|uniref:helix-turn-helix domain-containing protein n=1 Tax=Streptomyces adelaidensis TaxID=2796465 RepID=UPI00190328DD|nr:helix-turn-helix domain-containing protein [Streptomyces adelaidensis]